MKKREKLKDQGKKKEIEDLIARPQNKWEDNSVPLNRLICIE